MPTARFQTVCAVRLLIALLAVPLALAACQGDDSGTGDATATPTTQTATTAPLTTLSERDQVVSRLKEILAIRDRAIATRDASLLDPIYTPACPCRDRDNLLIGEMKKQGIRWETAVTTITPKRFDQQSDQRWVIVADLHISSYRVERDSGELVRTDPESSDRVIFALEAEHPSGEWLLADIRDL